jgi:hypothetical protein
MDLLLKSKLVMAEFPNCQTEKHDMSYTRISLSEAGVEGL